MIMIHALWVGVAGVQAQLLRAEPLSVHPFMALVLSCLWATEDTDFTFRSGYETLPINSPQTLLTFVETPTDG